MSNDLIVKSNTLVEAGYQLTTNEQRLILCAIACIPKGKPINPNTGYCISKSDFVELGVNPKTANREIREACDRLFNRYVTIRTEQGEFKTRWVQDITKYDQAWALHNREFFINTIGEDPDEEDCILAAITFSRSVIPFLTELKSNFTKYMLSDVAGFSSAYSFRIYEFIMQFKSTGYVKISIEDLRIRLDLGDKYPATKDLKVRVIDVAIKEINEKSPIKVKYELIKKGRKFVAVKFIYEPKEKLKKTNENESRDPNTPDIFSGLTDAEREIVAQKNAYADQIGATAEHRENLIRQGLTTHRQAEQSEQDRKEREKAERLTQEQQDKERLELAQRQFEQILNDDRLINAYIANNGINEKNLNGLQKIRYKQGDFKGVFEMDKYKFEELRYLNFLNLKFLD